MVYTPTMWANCPDVPLLDALYNGTDLKATAKKVARGMTYRMLNGPNAMTVYGTATVTQTVMVVSWYWLTLQIGLVLIA